MTAKEERNGFRPPWMEAPPPPGSWRSLFKWGDAGTFKHPGPGLVRLLKETFGLDDGAFRRPRRTGLEPARAGRPPALPAGARADLEAMLGPENVCTDDHSRLAAAYGKGMLDLLRLRRGIAEHLPDAVLHPRDRHDLVRIVDYCSRHGIPMTARGAASSVGHPGHWSARQGASPWTCAPTWTGSWRSTKTARPSPCSPGLLRPAPGGAPEPGPGALRGGPPLHLRALPAVLRVLHRGRLGGDPGRRPELHLLRQDRGPGPGPGIRDPGRGDPHRGPPGRRHRARHRPDPAGQRRRLRRARGGHPAGVPAACPGTSAASATCSRTGPRPWTRPGRSCRASSAIPSVFRLSDPEETEVALKLYGLDRPLADALLGLLGLRPGSAACSWAPPRASGASPATCAGGWAASAGRRGALPTTGLVTRAWEHGPVPGPLPAGRPAGFRHPHRHPGMRRHLGRPGAGAPGGAGLLRGPAPAPSA